MTPNPLPNWRRRWQRWRALAPVERALLLHFLVVLPLCAALLRLFGLRRTLTLLTRLTHSHAPASAPRPSAETLRHTAHFLTLAAALLPFHTTCLHLSVAFWWYCRRRGLPCDLRLGVLPSGAPFQAHAWVEYDGAVVNDDPVIIARYAPFPSTTSLSPSSHFD